MLCCSLSIKWRRNRFRPFITGFTLVFEFAMSLAALILALQSMSKFHERNTALRELDEAVEGCMDTYSDIPLYVIESQLDKPEEEFDEAAWLLTSFAGLVLLKIFLSIIIGIYIRKCYKKGVAKSQV